MTLRPDLEMYETDGNLEPIRHPEAQHVLAAMDEHRERQEKLMELWRACHAWAYSYVDQPYRKSMIDALHALGPPPDAAPEEK